MPLRRWGWMPNAGIDRSLICLIHLCSPNFQLKLSWTKPLICTNSTLTSLATLNCSWYRCLRIILLIKVVNDNTTQHSIAHPTDATSQSLVPDRKDDVEVVVLKEARGWTQFQAKLMTTARVFSRWFEFHELEVLRFWGRCNAGKCLSKLWIEMMWSKLHRRSVYCLHWSPKAKSCSFKTIHAQYAFVLCVYAHVYLNLYIEL